VSTSPRVSFLPLLFSPFSSTRSSHLFYLNITANIQRWGKFTFNLNRWRSNSSASRYGRSIFHHHHHPTTNMFIQLCPVPVTLLLAHLRGYISTDLLNLNSLNKFLSRLYASSSSSSTTQKINLHISLSLPTSYYLTKLLPSHINIKRNRDSIKGGSGIRRRSYLSV